MKSPRILHPILFAVYFVLFAYVHNFEFAPSFGVILILLVVIVGCAALLWKGCSLAIRNGPKAAIATSAFMLLFVSYGHVKNLITSWSWGFHVLSLQIGHVRMTAAVCVVVAILVAMWLRAASDEATRSVTLWLNGATSVLVLLGGAHLLTFQLIADRGTPTEARTGLEHVVDSAQRTGLNTEGLPDIYYIVLDAYGRSDILKDLYGYDNAPFIDWLRRKGFYVAGEAHSNYSQTMLSLASSLNMTYLDGSDLRSAAARPGDPRWRVKLNLAAVRLLNTANENVRLPLAHLIQRNSVTDTLRSHGYRFTAFTSGYGGVQFPSADVVRRASVLSDFEDSLIGATPIPDLMAAVYDQRELHRNRVNYVFDHLADSGSSAGPRFVFAHVLAPHSPFVFHADGTSAQRDTSRPDVFYDDGIDPNNPADRARVRGGYREQAEYVTQRIQSVLEAILADTTRRRIIVLQGDHGPNMLLNESGPVNAALSERMSILSAYYVPPEIRSRLYPSITPVNTFRIILSQYVGVAGNLLPDRSFFSPPESLYDFLDVTRSVKDPSH